jgi:hypothetical protein
MIADKGVDRSVGGQLMAKKKSKKGKKGKK